jgi:hypothetical protein
LTPDNIKPFYVNVLIDGSTFIGTFDLGMGIDIVRKAKLINIKCHNTRVQAGIDSKNFVADFIKGKKLLAKTFEDRYGKYATILIVLYVQIKDDEYINLNDLLIEKSFATFVKDENGAIQSPHNSDV